MNISVIWVIFVVASCCTMTSLAMTSNTFSKILSSSGAQVCSSDSITSPYHVFQLFAGGEMRCGIECLVSSLCWYYQFKTSTTLDQCELYSRMPMRFSAIYKCGGFVKRVEGCPDGWIRRGEGCYQLVVGQFLNWNQADEYCSALSTPQQSHLVNIESIDKQQLVAGLIDEFIPVIPTPTSVNLALRQPTWQSSLYFSNTPDKAVDGNKDTSLNQNSCSHTGGPPNDPSPWMAVDLGKPTDVYGAAVTNRDCCADREEDFIVGLTNNPPRTMPPITNSYTTCGQWPGHAPISATMFVRCVDNLPPARYVVIIQQYQPRGFLQICELEIYQKGVFTRHSVNLALNRPTWQSSTYGSLNFAARVSWYAVDGNNRTDLPRCAHTADNDTSSWWAVDLGSKTYVYGVAFTSKDTRNNYNVVLTNNPPKAMPPTTNGYNTCGQWPGSAPASATMFVRCVDSLPPARYVVILQQYLPRGALQICELEVYGKAFVWLNGRRASATSLFEWSPYSNSPMPLTYTNWAYGMPDTAVNSSCLAMDVVNGTWHDMQCDNPSGSVVYAICETPKT